MQINIQGYFVSCSDGGSSSETVIQIHRSVQTGNVDFHPSIMRGSEPEG